MTKATIIRMKLNRWFSAKVFMRRAVLPSVLSLCVVGARGQLASVLTYHYDNARTGRDPEIGFGGVWPGNLDGAHFGKLYSRPVDGAVYGQPLYVPSLTIPGKGGHNVVFVVTEGDSVYAFDADNNVGENASPLWAANLIDAQHGAAPSATTLSPSDIGGCDNISPQIGITSTPVIDPGTGTMYVEAVSKEGGGIVHRLHALDITTGHEKLPGPRPITGPDLSQHLNRAGLLLTYGTIYIVYGPSCSGDPNAWVVRYDAATLLQKGVVRVSTYVLDNWMTGAALAADAKGIVFPPNDAKGTVFSSNLELGTFGVLLVPDQINPVNKNVGILTGNYDDGINDVFWFDRDCVISQVYIDGCSGTIDQRDNLFKCNNKKCLAATAAYWNGTLYYWMAGDVLKAVGLKSQISRVGASAGYSAFSSPQMSITTSLSSLCPDPGCGIVWALKTDPWAANGSAILEAYDATDLTLLYSSDDPSIGKRDDPGVAVDFSVPTAVGGKVYVGTMGGLSVYGLFPPSPACTKDPPCLCTDSCGPTPPGKCPPHHFCQ